MALPGELRSHGCKACATGCNGRDEDKIDLSEARYFQEGRKTKREYPTAIFGGEFRTGTYLVESRRSEDIVSQLLSLVEYRISTMEFRIEG